MIKFIILAVIIICLINIFRKLIGNSINDSHKQINEQKKILPPNYRYWNEIEYDGDEIRCDWCANKRNEDGTGRKVCSKYHGYVDENYVCDAFVSGPKALAGELASLANRINSQK